MWRTRLFWFVLGCMTGSVVAMLTTLNEMVQLGYVRWYFH